MAVLRWGRSGVTLDGSKLRWGRSGVDGSAPASGKLRWGRSGVPGVAAVTVAVIAAQSVEPESLVTINAALVGGGSADSWTWRVAFGQPVAFQGSGASRSFVAPSMMPPGGSSTIGVTATVGGTTSPERTVVITYLPQTRWQYDGTQWVGRRPAVAL